MAFTTRSSARSSLTAAGATLLAALTALVVLALAPAAHAGTYSYLLPAKGVCPKETSTTATPEQSALAMRCLTQQVRKRAKRAALTVDERLEDAAVKKAADIAQCGFAHRACGRSPFHWPTKFGYATGTYQVGENIGHDYGELGTPRYLMDEWLASYGHRMNLLSKTWKHYGIWHKQKANGDWVWVSIFGCRCR